MRAKDYYRRLEECKTQEEFKEVFGAVLEDLCKDADDLLKRRNSKRREVVAAAINEVNQKWLALISLHERKRSDEQFGKPIYNCEFLKDGFKAVYVQAHPEYEWAFDFESHKKMVDNRIAEAEARSKMLESFVPYRVIPYKDLTLETLPGEIMNRCAALGRYTSVGMPLDWIKPLAQSVYLLRYWMCLKKIDLNDVTEFEADPMKWINDHYEDPHNIRKEFTPNGNIDSCP